MTKVIIEILQAVQVKREDGDRHGVAARGGHLMVELIEEVAAVVDLREVIDRGQGTQLVSLAQTLKRHANGSS